MNYYERTTTIRDYQGSHHKAVYVEQRQFFKTNSEKVLKEKNKGLRYKFYETKDKELIKKLRKLEADKTYYETEQLTDRQVYWRPSIAKKWHY